MFIDQPTTSNSSQSNPQNTPAKPMLGRKELFIVGSLAFLVVIIAGGWWYYTKIFKAPKNTPVVVEEKKPDTSLPGTLGSEDPNNKPTTNEETNIKSENLTFGSFYKEINDPVTINVTGVKLPLNVKSQVSNYYEAARKINLDPVLNNLNQNGFGVINNPFAKPNNNFFGIYSELNQRSIPSLVTSDFLTYYYQNSLKQIYKEVEASFFYDSVWRVTNELYNTANGRYQERRQKLGVASDSLLEAERLEAAYFAAGLVLLRPEKDQINSTEDINDSKKFKPSEAARFDFSVPGYLADDLDQEIKLIKAAQQTVKSPLLLYERNYQDFKIPDEYSTSAKLRNFYLVSRWYSSLFPLYYKDSTCPNCLLDREDWIINQSSAHLIASDLSSSQSLKNEWAKIYKVISFFSGLRSELTYLHYQNLRLEIFKDASLEEVFGVGSFDRLIKLREGLAKLEFKAAEGAYSRQSAADKPILGMRLLQTAYWPSRSFYSQLTNDPVGNHNLPKDAKGAQFSYLTSCQFAGNLYRCRGLGFDILNLVLDRLPKSKFILDNINYEKYLTQVDAIKKQLKSFNTIDWHNNNFWVTLSIAGAYVNEKLSVFPYSNTEQWFERKLSSALASMTNLVIPADTWQVSREKSGSGLEVSGSTASLNYIEPNTKLADELVANTKMLFGALTGLGVVKDNDVRFLDLLNKMETSRTIMRKELAKENVTSEDYQFISDLTSQFKIDKEGTKTTLTEFYDTKTKQNQKIRQTIDSPKIILLIYEKDGKKILTAGPVFSYKEQ
ncbi:MAG: DUF3160 domain-containing protein [Candidatus Falkowbacteria bacterium]|nr:DUF3160 domain-containing protein [Candidatus Falkowbacteria bacterium]